MDRSAWKKRKAPRDLPTRIRTLEYDENRAEERELQSPRELAPRPGQGGTLWVRVEGVRDAVVIEEIGSRFGIHPLLVEDVMSVRQRPKADDFGDYVFLVLKIIGHERGVLRVDQASVAFGRDFVLTFQEAETGLFEPIRDRILAGRGKIRQTGPDHLVYSILDAAVDNYFGVIEAVGEEVDRLEDELIARPDRKLLRRVQDLRNEVLVLRRSIWPLREVVSGLEHSGSPLIRQTTSIYFRDVYEHTIEIMESLDTLRDILSEMYDIYLSSVSNRLNEVMKVLTMIATIFIPLTFIVGLYGMNFEHMPELKWRYGYAFAWGVMLLVAFGMLVYFRKKKWF